MSIIAVEIVTMAVIAGGFLYWQKDNEQNSPNPEWKQVVQYNCEQSGGTFKEDKCECPRGALPDMYDKTSGYCTTDAGTTDGKVGQAMIESFNCKMELEKCQKDKQ